jgi:serine/threonine-protein kinase HipA
MKRRAAIEARKGEATQIYDQVLGAVKQWQPIANRLGISRSEQIMQQSAFNV